MDATRPAKRRKTLPKLDDSFLGQTRSADVPELHQGRSRAIAHQPGQWAAHVFVELLPDDASSQVLKNAVKDASSGLKDSSATVHSLLDKTRPEKEGQLASEDLVLHMSLSRPLILQTNQRGDLKAAVASVANSAKQPSCCFASFGWLENDDKTRRFLGVEVGSGYQQLKALVAILDEQFVRLRLPRYYDTPRFHCSLAWTITTSNKATPDTHLPFDNDVIELLNSKYGSVLSHEPMTPSHLCVKVGKVVTRYPFAS
ncbi:poly(U)-specific 3'-to-5' RNA exonuclease [Microbotryomycetes sp. JL201]|nr:poly(U)-specific 3'-to-5' RNA exonuclease [Microbotryomycetes sp. JL201]